MQSGNRGNRKDPKDRYGGQNAYWAHTAEGWDPQPLQDHLEAVAALAGEFASHFGSAAWGRLAGLWHDVGKHSRAFQSYLRAANGPGAHLEEQAGRTDHSTAGARHGVDRFAAADPVAARILAYCIAAHHAGLSDWDTASDACLSSRLAQCRPETLDALQRAPQELLDQPKPILPQLRPDGTPNGQAFQGALLVRMLFSCLVDADFLDTEAFMVPGRAEQRPTPSPTTEDLEAALSDHLVRLQVDADPTPVNARRAEVLEACLSAARQQPGPFSLTVPTGGGKTLSSLAFALRHARLQELSRVIYAIPFTSIVEQNADVFRAALGRLADTALVEHHSNLDPRRETPWNRLASENWDAPLVVTTNVQLFESLFAARTSRCRKLHNIARSVIILDEAQTIPVEYLTPCLAALRELVRNYGCTVVLCTATQPAIHRRDDFPIGLEGVREIVPDPGRLYVQMKRVRAEYVGQLQDDELGDRLQAERQVLCVVSTRRHAAEIHERFAGDGSTIHLSAAMCPRHRSAVIRLVKRRLRSDRPCRVISTQLIEAGVDIDFPVVYRARAGLDSIAQAAGRCNREGRLVTGRVYVFDAETPPPPGHLRQTAETARELLGLYEDLLAPKAVERYFELHYWKQSGAWDRHGIMSCFRLGRYGEPLCDFRRAAEAFRLIRQDAEPVIVPWRRSGRKLVARLRGTPLPGRVLRRAVQRYTVQVPARHRQRLVDEGCIEVLHDQYPVLIDSRRYRSDTGLSMWGDRIASPEDLIL